MNKEEIIKKLNENKPMRFVLFEARNLMLTFKGYLDDVEKDIEIATVTGCRHHMVDTIENLMNAVMGAIIPEALDDGDLWDEVYWLLVNVKMELVNSELIIKSE